MTIETDRESPTISADSPGDEPAAPGTPSTDSTHPIVFFDGVCGLCNHTVDFVLKHDRNAVFRFAPLQGELAAQQLTRQDTESLASIVYSGPSGTFRRSAAVVRILWGLGSIWKFCGTLLWLIPLPLRDLGYKMVAVSRYRLFGKKETCRMPTPEERSRFYD